MMRNGNGNPSMPTNTTTTIKPASQNRSGWVLLLGGGLLVANFTFGAGGNGSVVMSYLAGQAGTQAPSIDWGQTVVLPGIALLVLLGISVTGESGSNFAVIFLVAVWIIWLLNSQGAVQKILGQSSANSTSNTASTTNTANTSNIPPTTNNTKNGPAPSQGIGKI